MASTDPIIVRVVVPANPATIRVPVKTAPYIVRTVSQGPQGGAGPIGPAGPAHTVQVHTQTSAAATWIIAHALGRTPIVSVYDGSGSEMIADVVASNTSVSVIFAQPTTGTAVLV